jgi:hypothetical protein
MTEWGRGASGSSAMRRYSRIFPVGEGHSRAGKNPAPSSMWSTPRGEPDGPISEQLRGIVGYGKLTKAGPLVNSFSYWALTLTTSIRQLNVKAIRCIFIDCYLSNANFLKGCALEG